ncbi:maleylpyruvate isomerase N-terminal domain-containing protein [Amycolatopsis anabasis]|uniref:maleylpyruvate isomerase N-terminal domain-containing protein n=1 Tax=Amycolatopsis anabasis TaxID=1840409 RepID=UPI00131C13EB|nr:maleylpyruvate isomerase N-terminal domain-containing protein [Amycolatopsis anabasis]
MDAATLRRAAAECTGFLLEHAEADWTRDIPELEMTVAEVVAHIGNTFVWYPQDLVAGPTELSTLDIKVRPDASARELIATVSAGASVLALVIAGTPQDTRGWHPWGLADPSGFAGMACDELLVHTEDAARGLGVPFRPSPELAEATVRRLFPWAPGDADPWDALRWANGRLALPGHPRLTKWRWHCAPLADWNGVAPIE